ncbi:hypothetical protein Dimus_006720 [Dionaea muscipula]
MFFKCTRWQLEETLNPSDCPYHYYCHSTYPGNYPYLVDILVLAFVAASFLSTMVLSLIEIISSVKSINLQQLKRTRRYVLPSGPTSLPIMLLILAKGYRINTLFPITCTGPAILQLICISALAFESETGTTTSSSSSSTIRYLFLEASALSGAIHAALYLDSTDGVSTRRGPDPLQGMVSDHSSGSGYSMLEDFLQIGTRIQREDSVGEIYVRKFKLDLDDC